MTKQIKTQRKRKTPAERQVKENEVLIGDTLLQYTEPTSVNTSTAMPVMRNYNWRANQPKPKPTLEDFTFVADLKPIEYNKMLNNIAIEGPIKIGAPGLLIVGTGWIQEINPGAARNDCILTTIKLRFGTDPLVYAT